MKRTVHAILPKKTRRRALIVCLYACLGIGIGIDVWFFQASSDVRIFILLMLYVLSIWRLKLSSRMTFTFAVLLLLVSYIQFLFTDQAIFDNPGPLPPITERTAVWWYLFLVVGVIQMWREKEYV